jgi:aspartyl-tRNA(Asn)/glutamyl-tRNA(Gln) amidotransferase subunit C
MIDQKTIQHIAKLARLKITEAEAATYSDQLTKVLSHFEKISAISTEGVEPLVTPSEIEFYARPDVVKKENTADEMVANAPEKAGNLFKVPPVV